MTKFMLQIVHITIFLKKIKISKSASKPCTWARLVLPGEYSMASLAYVNHKNKHLSKASSPQMLKDDDTEE